MCVCARVCVGVWGGGGGGGGGAGRLQSKRATRCSLQVHTLLKEIENHRSDFCCCLAGYKDKMDHLMTCAPGLSRRFAARVHLEIFTATELALICRRIMMEQYDLVIPEEVVDAETG
eukprot:SAG31_NODE_203_length_20490_cov_7.713256_4_plen_117_part_00